MNQSGLPENNYWTKCRELLPGLDGSVELLKWISGICCPYLFL